MDEEVDVRGQGGQIDLRDRLRFAADSLAADFGGTLTADHAEALVFSSAEGLLAAASVTEFVPILAERRARLAVRSSAGTPPPNPKVPVDSSPAVERPVVDAGAADGNGSGPEPVLALAAEQLDRLRDRVDRVRVRVADWRAELNQR